MELPQCPLIGLVLFHRLTLCYFTVLLPLYGIVNVAVRAGTE